MIPIVGEDGEIIEVDVKPEEIATTKGAIKDVFEESGIEDLPTEK